MRPTVLLFDIDGTLVSSSGTGRRALDRAFGAEHGRADACNFNFDGMTDGSIVRQGLAAIGAPISQPAVDAVLARYLEFLAEEVEQAPNESYRLHAGMRRAVETGLSTSGVAVGLGTGNVREGARIKLTRVDIYHCFRFGGFGSDADDRAVLVRRGAERGAEQLGLPVEECRVVVIGDTPKDIAAAQANQADSVGVATGRYSVDALRASGATYAFPDLDAPGALETLCRNCREP
jgi:phosphoglycolate phosphatase-like HAD superfamily hydrolase